MGTNPTHGLSKDRLYSRWKAMRARCYNDKSINYKNYGAKGVKICTEWRDSPQSFIEWAINNGFKEGLTLDRHPNKLGDYSPSNCRWVTQAENNNSKSNHILITVNGETKNAAQWSKITGISATLIRDRFLKGWSHDDCINVAPRSQRSDGVKAKRKLAPTDVIKILNSTESPRALSEKFKVCLGTIYNIKSGLIWKHLTHINT